MMDAFKGKLTQGFSEAAKDMGIALADFFFPRVCMVCGEDTRRLPLCQECFNTIEPIDEAYTTEGLKIRAWARFTHPLDKLVYAFKYNHRRCLSGFFVTGMADALQSDADFKKADGLVPIPLHPVKRWLRTYNQSELISRVLSSQTGFPVWPILRRNRMTKTQTRLDDDARRRNVSGAFSMRKKPELLAADRTFILIDDVCTTGSTLASAARTLLDAGAERVFGLVVGGAWTNR